MKEKYYKTKRPFDSLMTLEGTLRIISLTFFAQGKNDSLILSIHWIYELCICSTEDVLKWAFHAGASENLWVGSQKEESLSICHQMRLSTMFLKVLLVGLSFRTINTSVFCFFNNYMLLPPCHVPVLQT